MKCILQMCFSNGKSFLVKEVGGACSYSTTKSSAVLKHFVGFNSSFWVLWPCTLLPLNTFCQISLGSYSSWYEAVHEMGFGHQLLHPWRWYYQSKEQVGKVFGVREDWTELGAADSSLAKITVHCPRAANAYKTLIKSFLWSYWLCVQCPGRC